MFFRASDIRIRSDLGSLSFIRPLIAPITDLIEILAELEMTGLVDDATVRIGALPELRSITTTTVHLSEIITRNQRLRYQHLAVVVFLPKYCVGDPTSYRSLLKLVRYAEVARSVRLVIGNHSVNLADYCERQRLVVDSSELRSI